MKIEPVHIADRIIDAETPCLVIAEAGVNHNGSVDMAHQLVDVAASIGADAVKFQTFKAENLVTTTAPKADYQQKSTDVAESQLDMLRKLELDADAHVALLKHCRDKDIIFLSTPFDEPSADLLDQLGVPAFKTPSGEITNLPYLQHVASKGKPVITSTGMSYLSEVEAAVRVIENTGNHQLILLHAVSNYPAAPQDINLRAMHTMSAAFGYWAGYSDHTVGVEVPLAAIALGARVLEKHFTLDRSLPGPDHQASMQPGELASLIQGIRMVEAALGHGRKVPAASEANTAAVARKSLIAACEIPADTLITEDMIAIKRPGTGLPPGFRDVLVGLRTRVAISKDALLKLDMFL
jgi:N,N'-diacetyllegionaminate synthase